MLVWEYVDQNISVPLGSTASSYDGGGPLETPWWAGTVPGISWYDGGGDIWLVPGLSVPFGVPVPDPSSAVVEPAAVNDVVRFTFPSDAPIGFTMILTFRIPLGNTLLPVWTENYKENSKFIKSIVIKWAKHSPQIL